MVIPRIVMQTWKTEELPDHWKPGQESIKKFLPQWSYVLMTDEKNRNFIKEYFPDFLSTYDSFPYHIQRCDAIRYAWLYINGGLYIDCDFELLHDIGELFEEDDELCLLPSSNTPGILTNCFMASKSRHPIWLLMMEEMKKDPPFWVKLERHLHVMNSTGPMALNRVVKNSQYYYKELPLKKLNPYTICDKTYNNPDAWLKPLPGSSWVGCNAKLYHWIFCRKYVFLLALVVFVIAIIVMFIL